VVHGPALQVSTDRHADDHRTFEIAAGAEASGGHRVCKLHEGGPDVVEELNLNHGLDASHRHTNGATDDICLCQWGVEYLSFFGDTLTTRSNFKDPTLALKLRVGELVQLGEVCDVFAEHSH